MSSDHVTSAVPDSDLPAEPEADDDDAAEIDRLFREHNDSLLRFLRARLHSSQEAKEVAQDAYVQLLGLRNRNTVNFLQGYLFRIAANLATNRLKQRSRRHELDELTFFEVENARSPEHSCAADQELRLILRAIEDLPSKCSMAFMLVRYDGLGFEEAAQRLGMHPRMVRRYVARAMEHCHRALQNQTGVTA